MLNSSLHKQKGAVLIVSLMLLVVLTMLGISALNSTKFETRMSANTAEYNRIFQAAEIGIAIPRGYPNATLTGIMELEVGYGKKGFEEETTPEILKGYKAAYSTRRVPGDFSSPSSGNTEKIVYFTVESKGAYADESGDSGVIQVDLNGGMWMPKPGEKNTKTTY